MHGLQTHTKQDAIVVANAFTARNVEFAKRANLDRTTVDKYFYYSALAERRLWVEARRILETKNRRHGEWRWPIAYSTRGVRVCTFRIPADHIISSSIMGSRMERLPICQSFAVFFRMTVCLSIACRPVSAGPGQHSASIELIKDQAYIFCCRIFLQSKENYQNWGCDEADRCDIVLSRLTTPFGPGPAFTRKNCLLCK